MASEIMQEPNTALTYSKCKWPLIGAFIDYIETSLEYLKHKTFERAERLNVRTDRASVSSTFLACVCLVLGLVSNVKFEVATVDDTPLQNDLHFVLLSREDKLYVDDVDTTRAIWCIEVSDCVIMLLSSFMVWNSALVPCPLSEYLFLPWLGATLRGLLLRQAPTACALLYTLAVVEGTVNPLFLTAFIFLFMVEARLWLEIARLLHMRWHRREYCGNIPLGYQHYQQGPVETLWTNNEASSFEVRNYVY